MVVKTAQSSNAVLTRSTEPVVVVVRSEEDERLAAVLLTRNERDVCKINDEKFFVS